MSSPSPNGDGSGEVPEKYQGQKRKLSEMSDLDCRKRGDCYLKEEAYETALEFYSKAVSKNPTSTENLIARAKACFGAKQFLGAANDSLAALNLEQDLMLGHYYRGQSLCELGDFVEGLKHLQKANEFAKSEGHVKANEVAQTLKRYRTKRREALNETEGIEGTPLHVELTRLIKEDRERKIDNIKNVGDVALDEEEKARQTAGVENYAEDCIKELNKLFRNSAEQQRNMNVPEYLCCKITLELMKDPVITPGGITYERSAIEHYLRRRNHVDPYTSRPLAKEQLIPNKNLKAAVEDFIAKNDWALE